MHHFLRENKIDAQQIPLEELTFRVIDPEDMENVRELHSEWFPLKYDNDFYESIEGGHVFSL